MSEDNEFNETIQAALELANRGEHQKALTIGEQFIDDPTAYAQLLAQIAISLYSNEKFDEAEAYLKNAIYYDKLNEDAQWLFREMNSADDYSKAKFYQIVLEGSLEDDEFYEEEATDFFMSYDLIANDEDEALEMINDFEPEEIYNTLIVKQVTILDPSPNQPKGVYNISPYYTYSEDDDSESSHQP